MQRIKGGIGRDHCDNPEGAECHHPPLAADERHHSGRGGFRKTTVAMHRISYILYNYKDDFRPEDFYIVGSNRILLNYITSVLPELDVYGIRQLTMEQLFVRLLYEDWDDASLLVPQYGERRSGKQRQV